MSYTGAQPSEQRAYFKDIDIFGIKIDQNMIAIDGEEMPEKVTDNNASAVLTYASISSNDLQSKVSEITLLVKLDHDKFSELENKISEIKASPGEIFYIKLGAMNEKQEYKRDNQWGLIVDLNGMALRPRKNNELLFNSIAKSEAGSDGLILYSLEFKNLMVDLKETGKKSIPFVCDKSTDRREFVL